MVPPGHFHLWDAVRAQYWEVLLRPRSARPPDEWHTVAAKRE